jgi:hypothetical protein
LLSVLPRLPEIGFSHAQRDLFERVCDDGLIRSNRLTAAQNRLEQRHAGRPHAAPTRARLAAVYRGLGLPEQAGRVAGAKLEGTSAIPVDVGPQARLLDRFGQKFDRAANQFGEAPLQRCPRERSDTGIRVQFGGKVHVAPASGIVRAQGGDHVVGHIACRCRAHRRVPARDKK